eukprot:m.152758 g.152758  ORF g.152758 m.152758 type:complete len:629 (+) comp16363_c1_seq27:107-1993(+)
MSQPSTIFARASSTVTELPSSTSSTTEPLHSRVNPSFGRDGTFQDSVTKAQDQHRGCPSNDTQNGLPTTSTAVSLTDFVQHGLERHQHFKDATEADLARPPQERSSSVSNVNLRLDTTVNSTIVAQWPLHRITALVSPTTPSPSSVVSSRASSTNRMSQKFIFDVSSPRHRATPPPPLPALFPHTAEALASYQASLPDAQGQRSWHGDDLASPCLKVTPVKSQTVTSRNDCATPTSNPFIAANTATGRASRSVARRSAAQRCTTTMVQPRELAPLFAKRYKSSDRRDPSAIPFDPSADPYTLYGHPTSGTTGNPSVPPSTTPVACAPSTAPMEGVAQRQAAKRASSLVSALLRPVARHSSSTAITTTKAAKLDVASTQPPSKIHQRAKNKSVKRARASVNRDPSLSPPCRPSARLPRPRPKHARNRRANSLSPPRMLTSVELCNTQEDDDVTLFCSPVMLSPDSVLAQAAADLTLDVDLQPQAIPEPVPHPCLTAYYPEMNISPVPLSSLELAPRPVRAVPGFGAADSLDPAVTRAVFLADHQDDALRNSFEVVERADPRSIRLERAHLNQLHVEQPDEVVLQQGVTDDNADTSDNDDNYLEDGVDMTAQGWGLVPLHRLLNAHPNRM